MPVNVTLGSTVIFTALFFDASSAVVVPSSATLVINYPLAANSLTIVSCSIAMSVTGNTFSASWGTGVAALGMSSYSVSAPGFTAATGGELRVIS